MINEEVPLIQYTYWLFGCLVTSILRRLTRCCKHEQYGASTHLISLHATAVVVGRVHGPCAHMCGSKHVTRCDTTFICRLQLAGAA